MTTDPLRGKKVDIGGRCLRVVAAGPGSDRPLVVFECGAFGCAADWAVVQARLAGRGLRSLAYDRAGLGYSDSGPEPRDGRAITSDLQRLLECLGEDGPLLLVGHSMAGLLLPIFVARQSERITGVVLVDAMSPEAIDDPVAGRMINGYRRAMNWVGRWSDLGFMQPVSVVAGNMIGLEGPAAREKRHIYGLARHARGAAAEVSQWFVSSSQAADSKGYAARVPVAVVTAGQTRLPQHLKDLQRAPALASQHGRATEVRGANHASLLGRHHAEAIVEAVMYVLEASSGAPLR